ncbi:hypothetical protein HN992_01535 [Candidatus Woesearchaeota archaeon]|jgi:hypothetical protein|nr:hypothetical protein [archaeon]MBT3438984.1 hypothetical protein [Candidatus Woesearchaeota archaeon]MBT4058240.1 hypothetical protein [Candidatus Woesearchaeota archaeon]MBT4208315.1 hypothetical protein [Candidatus Woesearchaeota archaeon]MBT4730844.1 hypothetical protein [Candidatus Woesearchaeota archaeon]
MKKEVFGKFSFGCINLGFSLKEVKEFFIIRHVLVPGELEVINMSSVGC